MIKLGDKEYPISYNWEAIEGIQTDLDADSLDNLYKAVSKVVNTPEGITNKDMVNVMKTAKVIIYHGLRGAAFENDTEIPFKTPQHVGARLKSFKEAGKQIGLFLSSSYVLFSQDPEEDLGKQTREATPD